MPLALLALLQWRPHLDGLWCGMLSLLAGGWLYLTFCRLARRLPPAQARWLMWPKLAVLLLWLVALLDPVSALRNKVAVKGKLLAVLDTSSSMDVADDYHQTRLARARRIVEQWHKALPAEVALDELEFDTTLRKPGGSSPGPAPRGTDLAGCLLALSERADIASYLGVALLTDGGDEPVSAPALPAAPLSVIAVGAEPATWNDVAVADVQNPPIAEKDVDFDISADVVARAGHGQGFGAQLARVRAVLERQASNTWEQVGQQTVDLASLRGRVRFAVNSKLGGLQCYRVALAALPGELSALNNSRTTTVEVRKKALHVLYFTRELGQDFKPLRNELGRDPGLSFTALFRTAGERFTLQGDRLPGDAALEAGFPTSKAALEFYDAIIIGSFPAEDCGPKQMQALIQYVEAGGALVFLGGNDSFGRGGFAQTSLAVLFPWRLSSQEPEPARGVFSVSVPPVAAGHPILTTVEELLARSAATLETANVLTDLKPGATPLLAARLGAWDVAVLALQPYGKGKVLGVASNTLWKWATQSEALRTAYGLFWRQAVRHLTGKSEGGGSLAVKWDKENYRPGELATAEVRVLGEDKARGLRFTGALDSKGQSAPVTVAPVTAQAAAFTTTLRFRERGEFTFRMVAYQGDRVLESYEKVFAVAPLAPEGSRLELDELFLRQLAERGGGVCLREKEADRWLEHVVGQQRQRVAVIESSLVEARPYFAALFLLALAVEWTWRRRRNLF